MREPIYWALRSSTIQARSSGAESGKSITRILAAPPGGSCSGPIVSVGVTSTTTRTSPDGTRTGGPPATPVPSVRPGPGVYIEVVNGSGGDITVTVDSVKPSNYGTDVNIAEVVTAGERRKIAVNDIARFAGADGLAAITYSGVTSLTVGAFRGPS